MSQHTLASQVPVLSGSNFRDWKEAMSAYLMAQGLWMVTNGDRDQMARGSMKLCMAPHLQSKVVSTAKATWDALVKEFGEQTHGIAYAYTSHLLRFRLTGEEHPHKEFSKLKDLRAQVKAAGVNIDKYVICILLIREFPKKYEAIAQCILLETDKDKLKLELLRNKCITEFERLQQPARTLAQRISAVKPKGANPRFQQQQQQRNQPANNASNWRGPTQNQSSSNNQQQHSNANQQQTGQSRKNSKRGGTQVKSRKANAIAQQAHTVAFSSISDIPSILISEYFENPDNITLPVLSVPCPTPPPPQTKHTIFGVNKDGALQQHSVPAQLPAQVYLTGALFPTPHMSTIVPRFAV
ncbi:hypothetical protein NMY22_g828 [Coprinellus aureogranulatus]|nr:hypothetical protein NMY22_g828 [Coprinellus aureogranulatus]